MGLLDYFSQQPTINTTGLLGADFNDPRTLASLNMAAQLLESGGPSTQKVGVGQALGRGLLGYTLGYQTGKSMLNDQEKLDIYRQKVAQELHGGSPYFQFLPTASGYAVGDARKGTITMPGTGGIPALMRGADDPTLQGKIAGAREAAKAPYDFINTIGADGEQFATPKSAIVGGQVPTMPGGAVPTGMSPYEKTAMEKSAEADVGRGTDADKKERQVSNLTSLISDAREALNTNPTDSWIGAKQDDVYRLFGMTSPKAQNAAKLETISGWMVSNVPRMEGPQSNYDVETYMTMAAKVGDRTVPVQERMAALDTLESIQRKYSATNQAYKSGSTGRPPRATHGGINPATGQMEYFDAQGNKL